MKQRKLSFCLNIGFGYNTYSVELTTGLLIEVETILLPFFKIETVTITRNI